MSCMPSKSTLAWFQPEDDVDTLFCQLSRIEPPDELIVHILARIQHLPDPPEKPYQTRIPEDAETDCAGQKQREAQSSPTYPSGLLKQMIFEI